MKYLRGFCVLVFVYCRSCWLRSEGVFNVLCQVAVQRSFVFCKKLNESLIGVFGIALLFYFPFTTVKNRQNKLVDKAENVRSNINVHKAHLFLVLGGDLR